MNLTSFLLTVLSFFVSVFLFSQNLFPNPDFEQYTACPTGYNQLDELQGWQIGNQATPDYFNCSFSGSFISGTPAQGTGVVGFWGGPNHPSCSGSGYAESISSTLTQPITAGKQYLLSFDIQIDMGTPNDCMQVGFYFYNSQNAPTLSGLCAPLVTPQLAITGSSIQQGSYTHVEFWYTPDTTYDQVLISPFTTASTSGSACSSYVSNRMYFNLDNLSLEEQVILPLAIHNFVAHTQESDIMLQWEIEQNEELAYLELQRAPDAIDHEKDFQTVSQFTLKEGSYAHYDYQDRHTQSGSWVYRIKAVDQQGIVSYSQRIAATTVGGTARMKVFPNPSQGQFSVQLDHMKNQEVQWLVLDLQGRMISQQTSSVGQGTFAVNLPNLATGRYILVIQQQEGETLREPLLIQ